MGCGKNQDKGKMSNEQRAAISKGATGKKKTPEHRKKISDGMKNSKCVKARKKKKE